MNLTNHKEKLLPNGKTTTHKPHLIDQFDRSKNFEARFDKLFQPAGHSYTMNFDAVRESYWLEYGIITHFDCSVYDTIHFCCRKNIPFSLDVLAKRMKVGKETLRESLDNLENAELLEIVKVNDDRGQYNCYLLKTPRFRREDILFNRDEKPESNTNRSVRATRKRILDAGAELPTEFLNDHIERLSRNVRKNVVKRERKFLRDKNLCERYKTIATELKHQKETRRFLWKEVSHTLGNLAIDFENFILSITKKVSVIPKSKGEFTTALKRFLDTFCNENGLRYNAWMLDKAEKLVEFFRLRLKIKPTKAETEENYYQEDENFNADNKETMKGLLRKTLEAKTKYSRQSNSWHNAVKNDLKRIFSEYLSVFSSAELENIVAEFVPTAIRQKILTELLN